MRIGGGAAAKYSGTLPGYTTTHVYGDGGVTTRAPLFPPHPRAAYPNTQRLVPGACVPPRVCCVSGQDVCVQQSVSQSRRSVKARRCWWASGGATAELTAVHRRTHAPAASATPTHRSAAYVLCRARCAVSGARRDYNKRPPPTRGNNSSAAGSHTSLPPPPRPSATLPTPPPLPPAAATGCVPWVRVAAGLGRRVCTVGCEDIGGGWWHTGVT